MTDRPDESQRAHEALVADIVAHVDIDEGLARIRATRVRAHEVLVADIATHVDLASGLASLGSGHQPLTEHGLHVRRQASRRPEPARRFLPAAAAALAELALVIAAIVPAAKPMSDPAMSIPVPLPNLDAPVRSRTLVIVDVSGSMTGQRLASVKSVLRNDLRQLPDDSEVELWSFSDDHHRLVPMDTLARNRSALFNALDGLQPGGESSLFRTLLDAFQDPDDLWQPDRGKSIVVFTDGADTTEGANLTPAEVTAVNSGSWHVPAPITLSPWETPTRPVFSTLPHPPVAESSA